VAQGSRFPGPTRHPHQLRDTAGTRIRREFSGCSKGWAAAATLGTQAAPRSWVTDEVDADRDLQRVAEVVTQMA